MDRTRHRSIGWSTFVVVALTAAVVAPVTAWAQHRFADVPPITPSPPTSRGWRPTELPGVRPRRVALLSRGPGDTGADGGVPPPAGDRDRDRRRHARGRGANEFLAADGVAVDSRRLGGRTASSYLGVAETAADSDRLGGKAARRISRSATPRPTRPGWGRLPEDFLAADGTAADSDLVDGLDASARPTGASASGPVVATVNAPVDGMVAVTAVVGYQIPSGTGGWTCSLTAGPTGSRELDPGRSSKGAPGLIGGELRRHHRRSRPEAGSNQVAVEASASGTTVLVAGSLSAVFSPFDAATRESL